jgi:hypothetical protein
LLLFRRTAVFFRQLKNTCLPVIINATLGGGSIAVSEIIAFFGTGEGLITYFWNGKRPKAPPDCKIQEELA